MNSQFTVINHADAAIGSLIWKGNFDSVTKFFAPSLGHVKLALPLFTSKVPAGFPSPAEEHVEKRLNPNDYLIDQEDATFFVSIEGRSMIELGLMPGDKAVVDRSKRPKIGDVVLAVIDGEFTIKTLSKNKAGHPRLMPANKEYKPIEITEGMQFEIWGVVIGSFRRFT